MSINSCQSTLRGQFNSPASVSSSDSQDQPIEDESILPELRIPLHGVLADTSMDGFQQNFVRCAGLPEAQQPGTGQPECERGALQPRGDEQLLTEAADAVTWHDNLGAFLVVRFLTSTSRSFAFKSSVAKPTAKGAAPARCFMRSRKLD